MGHTKELEVLPANTAELGQLTERIIEYDTGVRAAFGSQMGYAFLAGLALNRAKDLIPHGNKGGGFMKWREVNLPQIPQRSAGRYMSFAAQLEQAHPAVGKLATVANFKSDSLQLAAGELEEADKQEVLKAVHEVADGKTLTQLYRDLGVIRQPRDPNSAPKKAPVKLTPAEMQEAILTRNKDHCEIMCEQIRTWLLREGALEPLDAVRPDEWWRKVLDAGTQLTAFCRGRLERVKRVKQAKQKGKRK